MKKNQDGYEAIWEHLYQRPIEYPKQRYAGPVIMNPDSFPWVAETGRRGVARRNLGVFSERNIVIAQIKLEPGATHTEAAPAAPRFVLVLDGTGQAADAPIRKHSLIKLETGERAAFVAESELQLLVTTLPEFTAEEIAAFERRNNPPKAAVAA